METKNLYDQAHLVVAMIRVLDHRKNFPPTLADVAAGLDFSLEQTNFICLKLKDKNIIEMVEDAFEVRLFVRNHLMIEELERGCQEDQMQKALAEFQEKRKGLSARVEKIHATQQAKQQKLFSEIEAMLKKKQSPEAKNFKLDPSPPSPRE